MLAVALYIIGGLSLLAVFGYAFSLIDRTFYIDD